MAFFRHLTHSGHIRDEIGLILKRYLSSGRVLDIPCGDGVNAGQLAKAGFDVECADLFPERAEAKGFECRKCDMTKRLPYDDESFDAVLHSEGIEHVDNQLSMLAEFRRILKPGGILIVTTPNILALSSRVNFLFSGHPRPGRWLVTESHGYWGGSKSYGEDTYYGHVFLINAFQLRFYLTHMGLDVLGVETTRYSFNSVLLMPFLYPFVWWGTKRMRSNKRFPATEEMHKAIEKEVLSPALLLGSKLIMVARMPSDPQSSGPTDTTP